MMFPEGKKYFTTHEVIGILLELRKTMHTALKRILTPKEYSKKMNTDLERRCQKNEEKFKRINSHKSRKLNETAPI